MKKTYFLPVLFSILISCNFSNNNLEKFNIEALPDFIDIGNKNDSNKLLILGNSIAVHPISKSIGWHSISGMAASNVDLDYVHLLHNKLNNLIPTNTRVSNVALWERSLSIDSLKSFDSLLNYRPNIVIFQVGDNFPADTTKIKQAYISLIKKFENTEIIICSPFITNEYNRGIAETISKENNLKYVNLSDLSSNKENLAEFDQSLDSLKKNWKVDGIGVHPGNKGMSMIASRIFNVIEPYLITNKTH
ncbi:SGNH/GDSL hydrolase family protein [Sphingobacterium bovistauri]|uniref:SGNH/GDSL hydrolase family protein n=1 Tax=Sphingobacterium bovistauri TaxID=2781959 RepID=A0ABS7Z9C6_9SPHI|nr:SGNH/GDSL hydrolase family protein [Sphingobacterium bovistauri]MCA5005996.1 SGNH/GDSL hydrolase family protein [Sphingobacterium bovistauri]